MTGGVSEVGWAHAQAKGNSPAGLGSGEIHAADGLLAGAGHAGERVGDVGGEAQLAGDVLAEADKFETRRVAMVNMKLFRMKHRLPDVHSSMYAHVYDAYRERYDAGLYSRYLPNTKAEAYQHFESSARWKHYW